MNNIYKIIIFIVIIPITIFVLAIITDDAFKYRMQEIKNQYRNNKYFKPIESRKVYELNDGIGFGFGKEFFTCPEPRRGQSSNCDLQGADIGIKFHTFKMNNRYNVLELDDVVLNNYCSQKYLEGNFINILNNIWNKTGLTFYYKDLIEEDEIKNITHYYNYHINENTIFPDCGNIEEYLKNPINMSFDNPTPSKFVDIFSQSNVPSFTTSSIQSDRYSRIDDSEKIQMAKHDIEILKSILSKENLFSSDNADLKKIIRNIMFRMIDESNYIDDNDLHICLVPFIQDDIAFILEGRNKRPILVISMYYEDCKKIYRVIEDVTTKKTCGLWLDKLNSNFKQLKRYEADYNSIAKIDFIPNTNNKCSIGIIDPSPTSETLLNNYISTSRVLLERQEEHKDTLDVDLINSRINSNTIKIQDILDYDYNNDFELKSIRKFKNRRGPITIIENGEEREKIVSYNEMRRIKIDQIKQRLESEYERLNREINNDRLLLNTFNERARTIQVPLENVSDNINSIVNPHLGTNNLKKLKKLKEVMDKVRSEINYPMEMANKIKSILGINLLLLQVFEANVTLNDATTDILPDRDNFKLLNYTKNIPICDLLSEQIVNSGIEASEINKNALREKRGSGNYIELDNNYYVGTILERYYVIGPSNKNNFHSLNNDKCHYFSQRIDQRNLCEKSKFFETSRENHLDLDAQYFIVHHLLNNNQLSEQSRKELEEFFNELKYKCGGCENNSNNYKVNSEYLYNSLFTNEEAIKNYQWLARFVYENRLYDDDNFNFIIQKMEALADPQTGSIFDPEFFSHLESQQTYQTLSDDSCDSSENTIISKSKLNDLIINDPNCDLKDSYITKFKNSFI